MYISILALFKSKLTTADWDIGTVLKSTAGRQIEVWKGVGEEVRLAATLEPVRPGL